MADDAPKIPLVTKSSMLIENGASGGHANLAVDVKQRHPVDALQRQGFPHENPYADLTFIRSVYGTGMAMEMAAAQQLAQREKKLFGMTKIGTGYQDIVSGDYETIQFSDYMNLPDKRSDLPKSVLHPFMERQLKNSL